jgi:hypothetical protein
MLLLLNKSRDELLMKQYGGRKTLETEHITHEFFWVKTPGKTLKGKPILLDVYYY